MSSPTRIARPPAGEHDVFITSVSGGKDSTAMALAMREAEIPCRYVFADTQWEAPETYEQLATLERVLGVTIDRVSHPGGMLAGVAENGGFPSYVRRWCTRLLKMEPLRAHHDRVAEECDADTVNVVGVRAEESASRAKLPEWEHSDEWRGYVWRPILRWTIADVLAIHHRHGMPVHPHYKLGIGRVGCWPCINSIKGDIALLAQHDPARVDFLEGVERDVAAMRAARNAAEPGRYAVEDVTFFQQQVPAVGDDGRPLFLESGARKSKYVPFPIREAVAWSRTERGGRETTQLRLFQPDPQGGCFRWGLCEAPTPAKGDGEP